MRVELSTTIKYRKSKGDTRVYPKGTVFDDSIGPIPKMIREEIKKATGTVIVLSGDLGANQPPEAPVDTADQPSENAGQEPITENEQTENSGETRRINK